MAIMDTYTINGITGKLVRMVDKNTAILFDGEENHTVKIEQSEQPTKVMKCKDCHELLTDDNFAKTKSGTYQAMCRNCLGDRQSKGHDLSEEKKTCSNCKKEQALTKYKQYKNGNYTLMCNKCRTMVYKANKNPEVKPKPTKVEGEITKVSAIEKAIEEPIVKDVIKPTHYRKPTVQGDLIDSWHLVMPMNEFRSAMKSHITKYVFRYNEKNGIEDLDKAIEFIERLKEKESLL